ncbi:protein MAK16 homolog isoform X2 [Prunus persica]|uniref:protein MAK16 homolog isoform X2 n=1 Tax=Prunus persica TaxID=3760 RepID=UPI0009AB2D91|nr:protein MAK16 homolog isoform X2 [Prunus persica]
MQNDEVIWQVIRHKHCSFMSKIETGIFCRNPYNVTGICNRSSCPLANSRYATIRDHDGVFYLYMKTIERAHMPNKLWERVKLPRNYEKALEIIDKHLMYWPKFLAHKTKQRLTKMTQMRIRMRKLALKTREKIMTTPRKEKKREARREEKAEKAAVLDKSIERELLERLKKGVYGDAYKDIYNYPFDKYQKVLEGEEMQLDTEREEEEEEPEIEYVEGYDELEEEDDIEDFAGFSIDNSHADDDNVMGKSLCACAYQMDSMKDLNDAVGSEEEAEAVTRKRERKESAFASRRFEKDEPAAKLKKKPRVLVEVEHEDSGVRQKAVH